jgi:ubiquinone/menaquinone biosynthesis C-methylase UbiE
MTDEDRAARRLPQEKSTGAPSGPPHRPDALEPLGPTSLEAEDAELRYTSHALSTSHANFSGSIPAIYDAHLGPLLFEFSALDLAKRVGDAITTGPVLEIACGTGISTHALREQLGPAPSIVATDLNPGMLKFAREHRGSMAGVRYELADAGALPYEDGAFDAVVSQFGIMFFPDLPAALAEMARVLRPGGFVACNVWDGFEANRVAGIAHETIARHFAADPPRFLEVPFGSCAPEPTRELFASTGFESMAVHTVEATIERPSALEVARGFVEGNPGVLEIQARADVEPEAITRELSVELERAFGPPPLRIPLREFVLTGRAPG